MIAGKAAADEADHINIDIMLVRSSHTRGRARVTHAVIVIFLEFFAWGLLTTPMLTVLHETFPQHTFLMNGLIQGVKGFLSFLSAPVIGALSDIWGRKFFLLMTVFFTCAPIPFMRISPWWHFALIAVSGIFAVTFSVIFAYVADITDEQRRSTAYGLVSATFAASLVTSPAIGAYLSARYGDSLVVLVATVISVADIAFVFFVMPESLPDKMRLTTWGFPLSWEQADPFASLRRVGKDSTVMLICVTVFLSYLPEAGQYSSFFLYLRQVIDFSPAAIAAFIAMVGILSIIAQTLLLSVLMRTLGNKKTVLLGLTFQLLQLAWYAFGSEPWMMWAAGTVAAMSSITFPAVSALVSHSAAPDQQGVVQGMITGIRGLCNGLGPALYGFIFFLFNVELSDVQHFGASAEVERSRPPLPVWRLRRSLGADRGRLHQRATAGRRRHQDVRGQEAGRRRRARRARSGRRPRGHAPQRRRGHRAALTGQQHVIDGPPSAYRRPETRRVLAKCANSFPDFFFFLISKRPKHGRYRWRLQLPVSEETSHD